MTQTMTTDLGDALNDSPALAREIESYTHTLDEQGRPHWSVSTRSVNAAASLMKLFKGCGVSPEGRRLKDYTGATVWMISGSEVQ